LEKLSPVLNGKKYLFPLPELSPHDRQIRRLVFRNERNLYHRKCDLTGKPIITIYSPDVSFPVYDQGVWHGDPWDALDYGMEFDFEKTFFEQFRVLYSTVPRINLLNKAAENSEYCHYAYRNKNCYLTFGSHYNEDCLYGNYVYKCVNCVDCFLVAQGELIYEGIDSDSCYKCAFIEQCFNSSECYFCYDLVGCKNCLFSANLRNKEYYIFNKPYSKAEYEKKFSELNLGDYSVFQRSLEQYDQVKLNAIHRAVFQIDTENCVGSNIKNSKNVYYGFDAQFAEDCRYLVGGPNTHLKDSMDTSFIGYDPSELLYQCINNSGNHKAAFCISTWHSADVYYSELCMESRDLFGCVGLKQKKNCILNKQYGKVEYEQLVPKIIEHMQKTGEWGQFFPANISPFGYNETVAQEYFPITKEEALKLDFKWQDYIAPPPEADKKIPADRLPDNIKDIPDDVLNWAIEDETGIPFKIIPQELRYYRNQNLPVPHRRPDQRHLDRMAKRTPRELFDRTCSKCNAAIQSAYSPDRSEKIYCETCYRKEIY